MILHYSETELNKKLWGNFYKEHPVFLYTSLTFFVLPNMINLFFSKKFHGRRRKEEEEVTKIKLESIKPVQRMAKTSDDLNHSSAIRFSRRFEDSFHNRQNKTEDSEQTEIERSREEKKAKKRIKVKKCFLFFVKIFTLSVLSLVCRTSY